MKMNCWEVKKCGRQAGGANVKEFGICPVSTENRLNKVHSGLNAGRACWVVAGTFCQGELQGTFAQKFRNCSICDFYIQVQQEEYPSFTLSPNLLQLLVNRG